jgi:tetratricopeptide (TPR) repeat protein
MSTTAGTVGDLLAEAAALHQHGDLRAAEAVYRELLRRHPGNGDALFRLGLLLGQSDRLAEALEMFSAALLIAPGFAPLWAEQAAVQMRLGRFDAAVASYNRLIALRPDDAEAFNNRGAALSRLARPADALVDFNAALAVRPDLPEALCNRGNALLALGGVAEALADYDRSLELRPNLAQAAFNRAEALERLDRPAEALASFDRAIAAMPGLVQAHYNRGNLLQTLDRHVEAIDSFDAALALRPAHAAAACNRAISLRELGLLDAALAGYDTALAHEPMMVQALVNRASLLTMQGRHQEALTDYGHAKAIAPDNGDVHWNEALCRLAMGDYEGGWREHEWRWHTKPLAPGHRVYPQPLWLGETSLAGRTILLHGEQGLGDVLQFCRFAPLVAALGERGGIPGDVPRGTPGDMPSGVPWGVPWGVPRGANVVLEVPYMLMRLIRTMPGSQRVIAHNEAPPEFDVHCPLLSLPLALGTTLATIPAMVPYLSADPDQERAWHIRLAALPGLRVGLVWAGNPRITDRAASAIDRRRSMPLARLAPLGTVEGVSFVSLQKGPGAEQAKTPPRGMVLRDWTDELWDFADTAALVAGLDLVISVDTSVVHLAGALGKPVWVLNRYDACWRWLYGRTDSPWYPTARLFRQPAFGDWDSVIAEVATALRELVG